ncbi:WD40/YVTN/BNR-like repeat-containing protein [Mucilaginibacter segetis]|uniref:Oxidoreductase n=1 Tax=Mucilaginibacter segetis TaxID=2793071 RepID=A0A934UM66_9SPHI|nr:YCF48-related protein [Mucilaginibacter segetis]MBK0378576.1 oxidoreductase [Mucilaginibacter segetis]
MLKFNSRTFKVASLIFVSFLLKSFHLKAQTITPVKEVKRVSIRGLSVIDNKTAWVSGTGGNVGITHDGGLTWTWRQVKGFEKSDFRDIEAFSDKEAIIMSSGTPAVILKTADGGLNWQLKYQQTDKAYFLDAMDFADTKHGFIMGDPIDNKFLLLETKNGGETWAPAADAPVALKDEAAFAASGTCLRVNGIITIVTGGSVSRMLSSPVNKLNWIATPLPLTNGEPSRGAFSVAYGKKQTIVVGGNYAKDKQTDSVVYILPQKHAAQQGNIPQAGPSGYQSCVEYLGGGTFLSTGTPGSNLTTDGGLTWHKIDSTTYNVCRKAKKGSLILLAGDGTIGIYKP